MFPKNKTKKIPWWMPQIGKKEAKLIKQVLDRSFPNEGEFVELFEQRITELLGCRHAVVVTSGTAALFLALKALKIGFGDEVIVPDITFIATVNAVEMCGASPVLVDINPKTMNIELAAFHNAITEKTKAVIPVHVSGRAADIEAILDIAQSKDIFVIEDAAEAFMSMRKGKCLGTFGKIGCFSFSPHKTITTGQGGVVVTGDDGLNVRLRELKDQGRSIRGTGGDDLHNAIGYNFKFTDLQAAIGLGQLTYLKSRLERMKRTYLIYLENLKDIAELSLFNFNIDEGEIPQWIDAIVDDRDNLIQYLKTNGIECRKYWLPIHSQKPYMLTNDSFPNSTRLSPKALWLPSAFTITDEEVKVVCDRIKKFMK